MPYTSFYQQQQQNFKNPYDVITQGAGSSTPKTGGTGSLPGQTSAPDLTSITDLVNSLNRQGQQAANEARVPGSGAVEQTLLGNTAQLAQGQLPADVIRQIQQGAAERGVSTGNDNYLQALGLNSLQAQQTAQGNLTAADARNPGAPLFNPATMLLTPAQQLQAQYQQGLLGLDWYKALTGQGGGYGGGSRGGGGGGYGGGSAQPTQDWFSSITGGTPSSSSVIPPSGYYPPSTTDSGMYPGTSVPGLPDLGSILGPTDPGYGYSPDPFGQAPPPDASNSGYWDFTNPSNFDTTTYDPFSQYSGG